jgi:predicted Zn-ribbon and HTH transcriptional regulator
MSKKIKFNQKNFFGINPERVINKDYLNSLKDIIKCSLCNKIMINPTDCEECGHSFCYDCISTKECPFKCKEKKLKPSSMGIKTMLNKLIFKCENKGCNEEIPYLNVKAHDSTCDYLIITCPNEKCEKNYL